MSYPSIFKVATLAENKKRLDKLTPESKPLWGKMSSAQMLAHLNLTYDTSRGKVRIELHPFMHVFLKTFLKKTLVGDKPYPKNAKTNPYYMVQEHKDFEEEKSLLLQNMQWVFEKGESYFEGRLTVSFGNLTAKEWSNLFQKHLDHHFNQFGV
ncbi:DUF1569 domain-containing protein [Wenyingzhuangia sp. 2_MG-2023]|uniref:DUF1569 domain-containing protein n=1 Tax=Wenyingzhuangia sp. 2_MG-2023 TaxID=3062639 RepID=UPI0026E221FD|nr:DUF1569 domain-containing protein [Wenyingzhuangia sp. 2_MG-2023]MDO6736776.1 hypothetical protein [Wenyingzhuangia sp. 2_MG-2023]MDO6800928.1 hypothetical protein [Wenyingzhuangia sp. 1_MG-2023]